MKKVKSHDPLLRFAEATYVGDGFTEEYEDGYPIDAHPDEVDYEKLRKTYPHLPPYADSIESVKGESHEES